MPASPRALTDRRELSRIGYGFMASQALFAALELDLFSRLSDGRPHPVAELTASTGVPANRLRTLLHALAGLGLLVAEAGGYRNAPACQWHLVRGAPGDLGEYFRLQVGRQLYPALGHLHAGVTGRGGAFDPPAGLTADPDQARTFTTAQHIGSIGAARALAARVPLPGAARLLDVGGGSGAFSIAFCERNPDLLATVLDFPAVVEVAREHRDRAGLRGRIDLLGADAVRDPWPADQDVVLLSYLLSALGESEIDAVLATAHSCLRPGGLLVVHDFMLDDDAPGPALAALWFLQYLAYRSDAVSFSAGDLSGRLRRGGFEPAGPDVLIPEITKVILARRRPARARGRA